jgi:hypothetical protein
MKRILVVATFLCAALLSCVTPPDVGISCPMPEDEPVLTASLRERSSCYGRCGGHGSKVPSGEQCLCFEGGGFPTCSDFEEECPSECEAPASCVELAPFVWDCTGVNICDTFLAGGVSSASIVLSCTP